MRILEIMQELQVLDDEHGRSITFTSEYIALHNDLERLVKQPLKVYFQGDMSERNLILSLLYGSE